MNDWHILVAKPQAMRPVTTDRRDLSVKPCRRVERELRRRGFETYCPTIPESKMRRGQRVIDYRPTLGRYLLVRGQPAHQAIDCEGVSYALVNQGEYATVRDAELVGLRENDSAEPVSRCVSDFPRGSRVLVKTGALNGYRGAVKRVKAHTETAWVDLDGGLGRVEIRASDLEVV